ncbi:MAG: 50S ribosomal protein L24 [Spirochaetales bacterium]|jgi:large subunit ribosomal protein L24|nr:50S ribosomal protein L24 [Spirochaetales bacterium]
MEKTKTAFRIKKNDEVRVMSGKEKGKSGRVLRVDQIKGRVLVEGLNMVKKAIKKKKQNDRGGIITVEGSIHVSNVMVVCKKCGPVRTGYKFEGGKKVRFCKKCGEGV